MTVLTAVLALGALTLALAFALSTASRRLRVIEDPRIDVVDAMLPRANCGACGYPGCRAFAEAVVAVARELTGFVWAIGCEVHNSGWQGMPIPATAAAD